MACADFPLQLHNWHLEISSKCALHCPRCSRQEEAGKFPVTELSLEHIRRLFTPQLLRREVKRITFSGGLGDPLYHSQLPQVVSYLKEAQPDLQLVLVTNGSHKSRAWWQDLAARFNHNDEVIFSIDGWDHASNNLYRIGSDWDSMMTGLEVMSRSECLTRWSTIAFRFNEDRLDDIQRLAEEKGADHFHLVLSERFGKTYGDPETGEDALEPSADKRSDLSRNRRLKVKFASGWAKYEKQRSFYANLKKLEAEKKESVTARFSGDYIFPTCGFGYRGLYVDVEGILYPCSWVAHPYGQKASRQRPGLVQKMEDGFHRYRDRLDLKKRGLEEILADPLWREWSASWASAATADVICENKCLNSPAFLSSARSVWLKEPAP